MANKIRFNLVLQVLADWKYCQELLKCFIRITQGSVAKWRITIKQVYPREAHAREAYNKSHLGFGVGFAK